MEGLLPISPIKDVTLRGRIVHAFTINKIVSSWMNESVLITIRSDNKPQLWAFILGVNCISSSGEYTWSEHVHSLTDSPFTTGIKLYQINTDNRFDFYIKCVDARLYYITIQKIGLNPTYNEGTNNKASEVIVLGSIVNSLPEGASEVPIGG